MSDIERISFSVDNWSEANNFPRIYYCFFIADVLYEAQDC